MPDPFDIHIREANLQSDADCAAIVHVVNTYAEDPLGLGRSLAPEVRAALPAALRSSPATIAFLAFASIDDTNHRDTAADTAIGVAVCNSGIATFHAKQRLNLHDLAVNPPYRGRGVGRALIRHAEQWAREHGCCALSLEVLENNPAKRLYTREGFAPGPVPMAFWTKGLR